MSAITVDALMEGALTVDALMEGALTVGALTVGALTDDSRIIIQAVVLIVA